MTQPQHSSQPTPRHRQATSNAAPASHTAAPGRHATHAANGQRRASGSTVAGARAPINAAQAAKRAAHAAPGETVRYRQEAAGVSRERAQALGKTGPRSHAPVIAGAIVGIALACLLIWFVGGAALRAFMDDGTTDEVIVADFENADAEEEAPKAVDADGTLEVMVSHYTFAPADGGTYTLARQLTDSTADPVPLFTVTGHASRHGHVRGLYLCDVQWRGQLLHPELPAGRRLPPQRPRRRRRHDRECCARGLPAAAHRGRWAGCIRWSSRGSKGWPERRRAAADYRGTSDRIRTLMRCRGRSA